MSENDTETAVPDEQNREVWHAIFAVGHPDLRKFQSFHRKLPSPPRCKLCFAPFRGPGSLLMAFMRKSPSNRNPQYCSACDKFMRAFPGGAEVELSMVFVDVRGSTALAETMSPTAYSRAMNGFYSAATKVFYESDGFVIDLVGDEVVAVYPPGLSGADHARKAIDAAQTLVSTEIARARSGARIDLGVGVHTGVVYIGTVTGVAAGVEDVRVLGDGVNTTARLASAAGPGEALISDAAAAAAGIDLASYERRDLTLKGKAAPVSVRVMRAVRDPGSAA
jgi:adenylate cyclase